RSDSLLVTLAARSYFDELLAAGVRIYEYGPRMLHTKAFIADDHLSIVGSANFDHRSFRLNFELSMMIRDKAVTAELAQLLENEFEQAVEVSPDRQRGLWRDRLPEGFARLASPLL
ncbi:MAG: phospholipase D-like domain-containing protein, partial [Stenotrophomonas koreensis]